MKLSEAGRKFIEGYEKRTPTAYKDSAGKWTIGIGHLITPTEMETDRLWIGNDVLPWHIVEMTDAQMDTLFAQDIAPREAALDKMLLRPDMWSQQQYDAMFSLLYNIGEENFRTSTVRRKANADDDEHAADAFLLWHNEHDPVTHQLVFSPGLMKRRIAERAMFLNGVYDSTH